jgi:hypothetical protein
MSSGLGRTSIPRRRRCAQAAVVPHSSAGGRSWGGDALLLLAHPRAAQTLQKYYDSAHRRGETKWEDDLLKPRSPSSPPPPPASGGRRGRVAGARRLARGWEETTDKDGVRCWVNQWTDVRTYEEPLEDDVGTFEPEPEPEQDPVLRSVKVTNATKDSSGEHVVWTLEVDLEGYEVFEKRARFQDLIRFDETLRNHNERLLHGRRELTYRLGSAVKLPPKQRFAFFSNKFDQEFLAARHVGLQQYFDGVVRWAQQLEMGLKKNVMTFVPVCKEFLRPNQKMVPGRRESIVGAAGLERTETVDNKIAGRRRASASAQRPDDTREEPRGLDDDTPGFKYEVQWTFDQEGKIGLTFDDARWREDKVMAVDVVKQGLAARMPHACKGLVLVAVQSGHQQAVTDFTSMRFTDVMGLMRRPRPLTLRFEYVWQKFRDGGKSYYYNRFMRNPDGSEGVSDWRRPPELDDVLQSMVHWKGAAAAASTRSRNTSLIPSDSQSDVSIQITVLEARNLAQMDGWMRGGKADPYVLLSWLDNAKKKAEQQERYKTKIIYNSLDPVWTNERFTMNVGEDDIITAELWDDDTGAPDDPMGQIQIPVRDMDGRDRWYRLKPMAGCDKPQGELWMRFKATMPDRTDRVPPARSPSTSSPPWSPRGRSASRSPGRRRPRSSDRNSPRHSPKRRPTRQLTYAELGEHTPGFIYRVQWNVQRNETMHVTFACGNENSPQCCYVTEVGARCKMPHACKGLELIAVQAHRQKEVKLAHVNPRDIDTRFEEVMQMMKRRPVTLTFKYPWQKGMDRSGATYFVNSHTGERVDNWNKDVKKELDDVANSMRAWAEPVNNRLSESEEYAVEWTLTDNAPLGITFDRKSTYSGEGPVFIKSLAKGGWAATMPHACPGLKFVGLASRVGVGRQSSPQEMDIDKTAWNRIQGLLKTRPLTLRFEHPWQPEIDQATGKQYYGNSLTGKSMWECPAELVHWKSVAGTDMLDDDADIYLWEKEKDFKYEVKCELRATGKIGLAFHDKFSNGYVGITHEAAGRHFVIDRINADCGLSNKHLLCEGMTLVRFQSGVKDEAFTAGTTHEDLPELLRDRPLELIFEHPWQRVEDRNESYYFNQYTGRSRDTRPDELDAVLRAMAEWVPPFDDGSDSDGDDCCEDMGNCFRLCGGRDRYSELDGERVDASGSDLDSDSGRSRREEQDRLLRKTGATACLILYDHTHILFQESRSKTGRSMVVVSELSSNGLAMDLPNARNGVGMVLMRIQDKNQSEYDLASRTLSSKQLQSLLNESPVTLWLESPWAEASEKAKIFYYNSSTNASVWDKPQELVGMKAHNSKFKVQWPFRAAGKGGLKFDGNQLGRRSAISAGRDVAGDSSSSDTESDWKNRNCCTTCIWSCFDAICPGAAAAIFGMLAIAVVVILVMHGETLSDEEDRRVAHDVAAEWAQNKQVHIPNAPTDHESHWQNTGTHHDSHSHSSVSRPPDEPSVSHPPDGSHRSNSACARGWRGDNCDHPTGCDDKPCGAARQCFADGGSHICATVGPTISSSDPNTNGVNQTVATPVVAPWSGDCEGDIAATSGSNDLHTVPCLASFVGQAILCLAYKITSTNEMVRTKERRKSDNPHRKGSVDRRKTTVSALRWGFSAWILSAAEVAGWASKVSRWSIMVPLEYGILMPSALICACVVSAGALYGVVTGAIRLLDDDRREEFEWWHYCALGAVSLGFFSMMLTSVGRDSDTVSEAAAGIILVTHVLLTSILLATSLAISHYAQLKRDPNYAGQWKDFASSKTNIRAQSVMLDDFVDEEQGLDEVQVDPEPDMWLHTVLLVTRGVRMQSSMLVVVYFACAVVCAVVASWSTGFSLFSILVYGILPAPILIMSAVLLFFLLYGGGNALRDGLVVDLTMRALQMSDCATASMYRCTQCGRFDDFSAQSVVDGKVNERQPQTGAVRKRWRVVVVPVCVLFGSALITTTLVWIKSGVSFGTLLLFGNVMPGVLLVCSLVVGALCSVVVLAMVKLLLTGERILESAVKRKSYTYAAALLMTSVVLLLCGFAADRIGAAIDFGFKSSCTETVRTDTDTIIVLCTGVFMGQMLVLGVSLVVTRILEFRALKGEARKLKIPQQLLANAERDAAGDPKGSLIDLIIQQRLNRRPYHDDVDNVVQRALQFGENDQSAHGDDYSDDARQRLALAPESAEVEQSSARDEIHRKDLKQMLGFLAANQSDRTVAEPAMTADQSPDSSPRPRQTSQPPYRQTTTASPRWMQRPTLTSAAGVTTTPGRRPRRQAHPSPRALSPITASELFSARSPWAQRDPEPEFAPTPRMMPTQRPRGGVRRHPQPQPQPQPQPRPQSHQRPVRSTRGVLAGASTVRAASTPVSAAATPGRKVRRSSTSAARAGQSAANVTAQDQELQALVDELQGGGSTGQSGRREPRPLADESAANRPSRALKLAVTGKTEGADELRNALKESA